MDTLDHQQSWDLDVRLPQLFLVMNRPRQTVPGRKWYAVRHQCAGVACQQQEFYGTPVAPSGKVAMALTQMSQQFYGSEIGALGTNLDDILEYRAMLQAVDLDCKYTYPKMVEGFYPIDLPEHLDNYLEEQLPAELDDLIDWDAEGGGLGRMVGFIGRWSLVWVSPNSD